VSIDDSNGGELDGTEPFEPHMTSDQTPADQADDELVARRRDVRGGKRREQILQLLQTVESGALSVE
jgi:hypothetical protein